LSYFVIEAVQRWEKRVQIDEVKLVSFKDHKLSFKILLTNGKEIGVEI
jgi:GPW/gp25 family protein